jgi:hypothetical protein
MLSSTQPEFITASLLVKPSAEAAAVRPADLKNDQSSNRRSSVGKRAPLAFTRHLVTFFIGVAAAVAWQTYGDAARHLIALAAASPDQQLNAVPPDLDLLRRSIDALATGITTTQEQIARSVDQLVAGQEQMTHEIAKLQAVEQYVLYKKSDSPMRPAPAQVPKPVLRPSQTATALKPRPAEPAP